MKLSGVLFVLAFVVMMIVKIQPEWLFGKPNASITIRKLTPAEQPAPRTLTPLVRR